jgi:hypothetical protein
MFLDPTKSQAFKLVPQKNVFTFIFAFYRDYFEGLKISIFCKHYSK